jgi:O-antigen ligase
MTVAIRQGRPLQRLSLADALPQMLRWNAGLAVALLPIGVTVTGISWVNPFIMACDAAMFLAALLGVLQLVTRSAPKSPLFVVGLLFVGAQILSFVVHPDFLGVIKIARTFGLVCMAEALASLAPNARAKFEKGIIGVGLFEILIIAVQRIRGAALAPGIIEFSGKIAAKENASIAVGSLLHQYILAGLGILVGAVAVLGLIRETLPPLWAFAGIGTCAYLVTQSVGRAALLGLGMLAFTLTLAGALRPALRKHLLISLAILVACSAAGYQVTRAGWKGRTENATITNDAGRPALYKQAFALWKSSPIVGVGPGRYNVALLGRPDLTKLTNEFLPVHSTPLHLAAETGLVGLIAVAGFAVLLWKRIRALGLLMVLPATALAPFLVFDVLHWVVPLGTLQLAVFVGMLAYRNTADPNDQKFQERTL